MNASTSPATPPPHCPPSCLCHQCRRCHQAVASLHADIDRLNAILDRKLLESYASHPGYAPKREVRITA